MSFLQNLQIKLHHRQFSKALQGIKHKRVSVDFKHAQTIGLLFDATELVDRELVLKFAEDLEKSGKKVHLLGFFKQKSGTENSSFASFNLKSLDFKWLPTKSKDVQDFMQRELDILINLSLVETEPLEYISAFSKAKFRVGPSTQRTECYEMMIDLENKTNIKSFIKQVVLFLETMNSSVLA